MAEEIEIAQEEQEIEVENTQLESAEVNETTENVQTQEDESKDDRDPTEGLKKRINKLTAQKHNKDDVIKEQERMIDLYETKFGKLKEVDEIFLNVGFEIFVEKG